MDAADAQDKSERVTRLLNLIKPYSAPAKPMPEAQLEEIEGTNKKR
jgi:hypothetical protein